MAKQEVAMRKRQKIQKANRTMFIWVAGASALLGIAAVLSIYIYQQFSFNNKVIGETNKTLKILESNNRQTEQLRNNVNALRVDQSLSSAKLNEDKDALQVVLDALPSSANSSAFGASLQNKIFNDPAIKVESLKVIPVEGVESTEGSGDSSVITKDNSIMFQFSISANNSNLNALKDAVKKLEKSIRPIDVTKVVLETRGATTTLTGTGATFYEPGKDVKLKEKTVKL